MKNNIVHLIRDDIKIARLIIGLKRLDISAYKYHLGSAKVIFSLMGIPDDERNTDMYYRLIDEGGDLSKYDTSDKVEALAERIFEQLSEYNSTSNNYVQ
ncbi:hypothetical protein H9Y05_11420 [Crocinitomicaceae bacterium CZZ-1]|uniref:Uncharacterized protein n=1 Tax=Taishania pollutisoli TaxID=2766479 RepID=A0A8J6PEC1_9FLAO|nr:hypothetical protein [Taishania pollutisoli]MBC9813078.1 hypothetical protein [Taishania pollutisoli]MBX2948824.1 hypothetical protein [Crocinitomicaceae bacterium]NGF75811.1 hypothetical protein [Fluviicola sp. SGL-29]